MGVGANVKTAASMESVQRQLSRAVTRVRGLDRQQLDTVVTSFAFIITNGLFFLNSLMINRSLGDDGAGAVQAAYRNTIVLGWAFQIGVPAAAAYVAKDIDHRRVAMSAWNMTLRYAVPMALALTPFYWWMMQGDAFDQFDGLRTWFIAFIVLSVFNGPFLSCVLWLRGIGNTMRFNLLLALPQLLITLGYAIWFISGTMTVTRALTSTMIALVVGWSAALIITDSLPGRGFSRDAFTRVRSFAFRSWVGNLSFFVSLRFDMLLLTGLVSSGELGIYGAAVAVSQLSSPVARGIAQGVFPHIRKASDDDERIRRINTALRSVALASLLSCLALAAAAEFLVPFLFKERFADAVTPLLLLLPGAFATDVTQVYTSALGAFDRPEDSSKAQVAAALATAAGLAILLPLYKVTGAAITTSIAYWIGLLASMWYWRRLIGAVRRGETTGHTEALVEEPA